MKCNNFLEETLKEIYKKNDTASFDSTLGIHVQFNKLITELKYKYNETMKIFTNFVNKIT